MFLKPKRIKSYVVDNNYCRNFKGVCKKISITEDTTIKDLEKQIFHKWRSIVSLATVQYGGNDFDVLQANIIYKDEEGDHIEINETKDVKAYFEGTYTELMILPNPKKVIVKAVEMQSMNNVYS